MSTVEMLISSGSVVVMVFVSWFFNSRGAHATGTTFLLPAILSFVFLAPVYWVFARKAGKHLRAKGAVVAKQVIERERYIGRRRRPRWNIAVALEPVFEDPVSIPMDLRFPYRPSTLTDVVAAGH